MLNVLSVDVEDYHDQLALDMQNRIVPPDPEAVRCTDQLLDLFAEYDVKGTFFILGEIAEHFPDLVRRIADAGHHLGVHGYYHLQVFKQSPAEFRDSIQRAKGMIEDLAGRAADAHRAVAFSVGESTLWALEVLVDLGFKYDSSVFPFRGRRYGMPGSPRRPHRRELTGGRAIWEVPMTVVERFGRRWPACGGGYLRLFPLRYTDWAVRTINAEGAPAVVYLHPYEVEPSPCIETLPGLSFGERCRFEFFNFQQTRRRKSTIPKLRWLFANHRFGTIEQVVAETSDRAAAGPIHAGFESESTSTAGGDHRRSP